MPIIYISYNYPKPTKSGGITDGQLFTPPISSGLLPGILRAELFETGRAIEKTLELGDLIAADNIYLGNSLRGLIPAKFMDMKPS